MCKSQIWHTLSFYFLYHISHYLTSCLMQTLHYVLWCISVWTNHSFPLSIDSEGSYGSVFSSCSLRYTQHWPKVGVIMGAYIAALLTLTTSGQIQNKPSSFSLLPYGIVGDDKPQPWLKPDLDSKVHEKRRKREREIHFL